MHTGGDLPDGPGWFYPATVLTGVTPEMRIYREECFGPVACVYKVSSLDEAIALSNDSEFGLAASVWSSDARRDRAPPGRARVRRRLRQRQHRVVLRPAVRRRQGLRLRARARPVRHPRVRQREDALAGLSASMTVLAARTGGPSDRDRRARTRLACCPRTASCSPSWCSRWLPVVGAGAHLAGAAALADARPRARAIVRRRRPLAPVLLDAGAMTVVLVACAMAACRRSEATPTVVDGAARRLCWSASAGSSPGCGARTGRCRVTTGALSAVGLVVMIACSRSPSAVGECSCARTACAAGSGHRCTG